MNLTDLRSVGVDDISTPTGHDGDVLLQARDVSKTFPGMQALRDVDLTLRTGRITALLGHNGSGKSTLVKILAGVHHPDPGAVITDGQGQSEWQHRIHFIHQDLGLLADLTVLENLDLGRPIGARFVVPRLRGERRRARALLDAQGAAHLDLDARIRDLAAADQALIAIARAMAGWESPRQILVLDEPTAALPDREAQRLLGAVRGVCDRGAAVLYISHRLHEVVELADEAIVLRDGEVIAALERGTFDAEQLVELIAGSGVSAPTRLAEPVRAKEIRPSREQPVALAVRNLRTARLRGLDFDVRRGEILGIAGVNGSGAGESLSAIFGATPRVSGDVATGGDLIPPMQPRRAIREGLALVPGDRRGLGAIVSHTAGENLMLPRLSPLVSFLGVINRRREQAETSSWMQVTEVRPSLPERVFAQFSGGNQQKIVLAKWMRTKPRVLLLEEPTQGVDAGAQAVIYAAIRSVAAAGGAIVVASSDSTELATICHRVLVLNGGRVQAELTGDAITRGQILREMLVAAPHPNDSKEDNHVTSDRTETC